MGHGGKRKGAGRPKGIATKAVRMPTAIADEVVALAKSGAFSLPLYSSRVAAGTPAAADDNVESNLNLFGYLVKDPTMTFLVRADGDSMVDAGINPGAMLAVERGKEPKHGQIIVAAVDGMLTVKRLYKRKGMTMLVAENEKKKYLPIILTPEMNVVIWGVVRGAIHLF